MTEEDLVVLFVGRITGPEQWNGHSCKFNVISLSNVIGKQTIGRILSVGDYPNAPEASLGSFLPIPIGNVKKVPGIPVYKTVETRLTGYPYLFYDKNYPIKAINDIYNDGHLVDASQYTKDTDEGIVTFKKKPHFLESADSRFWYSHFDEAHSSNKAIGAINAIDSKDTSDSAQIDKSHTPFAVKQTGALRNQGQIGRTFLQVTHREDGSMLKDSITVEIEGIGEVAKLSRPGKGDSPGITGSPDFSLNVVDTIAVNFVDSKHSHTNSANNATTQNASGGVGTFLHRVRVNGSQRISFPSFSGRAIKIEYSISINNAESKRIKDTFLINRIPAVTFPANSYGTLTGSATINHQSNFITITKRGRSWATIQIMSASRTVHFSPNSISLNRTGNSASKSGTVNITKSKMDMSKVKVSGSSNSFTDNIDISSHVKGDWNWFKDKVLKIKYNGNSDNRKVFIIAVRFVIEYAFSRVVYSENISAHIEGVVDDDEGSITGTSGALIERPDRFCLVTLESSRR